jgi:broad specificity phosphatase PhoE
LAPRGIDVLLASDLARAAQTAAILGKAIGLDPIFVARLRELDIGRWAGLTRAEIERREPDALARFEAGDPDVRAGGGESRRELRSRMCDVVRQQSRQHAGRLVALVAHLGVVGALRPGLVLANAGWCLTAASEFAALAPGAAPEARG